MNPFGQLISADRGELVGCRTVTQFLIKINVHSLTVVAVISVISATDSQVLHCTS